LQKIKLLGCFGGIISFLFVQTRGMQGRANRRPEDLANLLKPFRKSVLESNPARQSPVGLFLGN